MDLSKGANDGVWFQKEIGMSQPQEDSRAMLQQVRVDNMRHLIRQEGGLSQFAKKLGRAATQVSRYTGPNPSRKPGDKTAREVEKAFGLELGAMDKLLPGAIPSVHNAGVPLASAVIRHELDPATPMQYLRIRTEADKPVGFIQPDDSNMMGSTIIPPGAAVIADQSLPTKSGCWVLACYNKDPSTLMVRRLEGAGKQRYLLAGNPNIPRIDLDDDWEIIGVCVEATITLQNRMPA